MNRLGDSYIEARMRLEISMMKILLINENVVDNHFSTAEKKWESELYITIKIDISMEKLYSIVSNKTIKQTTE